MKKTLSAVLAVMLLSLVALGTLTSCSLFGSKYEFTDLGASYEFSSVGESTDSEIVVPEKYKGKPVTSIGKKAFYRSLLGDFFSDTEYPEITAIVLPDTITEIGDYAFEECTGLTSLTIPDSVTKIGEGAFYNCTNLVSVNIPDGITKIKPGTFAGCYDLASISIPESVKEIGNGAFQSCASLTSITLPEAVTEISAYCFSGCSSLASFAIPEQIKSIGAYAFEKCNALTAMTIPNTVKVLGDNVFNETGENLVVSVSYDEKPQEEWSGKWYYGMAGKAMNTSQVYFENVVKPNLAKAEEKQAQIDAQREYIEELQAELASIKNQLASLPSVNPDDSLVAKYESQRKEKAKEIQSAQSRLGDLLDELAEIKTTAQIN